MTMVDDFDDVTRELEDFESRMERLEQRVGRIAEQLAMLQRRDHASSAEVADFDTASEDEVQAGRDAVTAQQLARHLLTPQQRQQHQHSIKLAENLRAEIGGQEQELVRTARAVAGLTDRDPRSEQHQQAKKAYEQAKTTLQRLRLQRHTTAENDARKALRADQKDRAQHGAAIDTGRKAEQWLRQQLYDRIGAAVGRSAQPPVWFSTALGDTPPSTCVEKWMHTAVSLLLYRRAFDVGDPVVALGPRPVDAREQQRWHDDLAERLKQDWPS